jgi:hypothetical protein
MIIENNKINIKTCYIRTNRWLFVKSVIFVFLLTGTNLKANLGDAFNSLMDINTTLEKEVIPIVSKNLELIKNLTAQNEEQEKLINSLLQQQEKADIESNNSINIEKKPEIKIEAKQPPKKKK